MCRRIAQPALTADDPKLPHISFVVISHNHYDHLDYNSVVQLHKRYGDQLAWYSATYHAFCISNHCMQCRWLVLYDLLAYLWLYLPTILSHDVATVPVTFHVWAQLCQMFSNQSVTT